MSPPPTSSAWKPRAVEGVTTLPATSASATTARKSAATRHACHSIVDTSPEGAEGACTPDSVKASEEAVAVISLGRASRPTSCDIARSAGPAAFVTQSLRRHRDSSGLAPGGVYPRPRLRGTPCALTARFHPCRSRAEPSGGGLFLWHFPSSCPDRTLSCTLPDGARTFLDACAPRRPGVLRDEYRTRTRRSPQPPATRFCRWNRST